MANATLPSEEPREGVRRAVVLSGGGARGAYEAGVMRYVFDELPARLGYVPRIDLFCGTSVGAVHACYPAKREEQEDLMGASLDHAMWFQRPARADDWVLLDMSGHGMIGGRGLATGLIFHPDGSHIATVAQEGLLRAPRRKSR